MQDYVKPTKQGFNQDLYIFHVGTDDFLHKENCNGIVNVTESLKYNQNTAAISIIVLHADNFTHLPPMHPLSTL